MTAIEIIKHHIGKEMTHSPSAYLNWLKPKVLAAEIGKLTLEYTIREEMGNAMGNLHGGVSAGIIDDLIGTTVYSLGEPQFYATINLHIDYFSAVKIGEKVIAESNIVKKGKQLINVECSIWNADKSRLVVRGQGSLLKTELKK